MKQMHLYSLVLLLLTLSIGLLGCGAVPINDRYGNANSQNNQQAEAQKKFDFAPYSAIPGYLNDGNKNSESAQKIWYGYDTSKATLKKLVKVNGYRVQILSTDSFDEADNLKLDVHTHLKTAPVYVVFESPYYKVRVGDITESNHAYDLSDKLKQLGYKNTLIVQDSVLTAK